MAGVGNCPPQGPRMAEQRMYARPGPGSSFMTQMLETLPRAETQRVRVGTGICILQQWHHHCSINMIPAFGSL